MAGQNDFLVFDENNSNILTQEMYEDDADRQNGFKRGLARSNVNNKVLRQTSMMATAIGEYIKDNDENASDGNLEQLKNAFKNSVVSPKLNQTITGSMTFAQPINGSITSANQAVRDGDGNVISETYARYTDYPTHALKAFKDEGEPLIDKEALDDIIEYKYSSFCGVNESGENDPKKFNKEGNPIIENGIASGFSTSNYLTTQYTLDFSLSKKYKIICRAFFDAVVPSRRASFIASAKGSSPVGDDYKSYCIYKNTDNAHLSAYFGGEGTAIPSVPPVNKWYDFIIEYDNGTAVFIIVDAETGIEFARSSEFYPDTEFSKVINLGFSSSFSDSTPYTGSIDLKQFLITVDDEEVFSGRKTGIDVLKPNDFSTVTKIFAYKYSTYTVYADKNASPTTLYNDDGSYYTGMDFIILNNAVGYPVIATYSPSDNITVGGATLYAFKSGNNIIYANDSSNPTTLLNADGTTYTGSGWIIKNGVVKFVNPATYTSGSNITLTLPSQSNPNYTCDSGVNISADGVASGFSNSNYIQTPSMAFSYAHNYILEVPFILNPTTAITHQTIIQDPSNYLNFSLFRPQTGTNNLSIYFGGGGIGISNLVTGKWLLAKITMNGINGSCSIINLKTGATIQTVVWTANADYSFTSLLRIGSGLGAFSDKIDLNGIKVYIDGNLVYQPCLKIPYTQSAEQYGSKIVDEKYRDRVIDAYEQGFEQRYYTLQEHDKGNYLVVGSPTISSDWIASGFTTTKYIRSPFLPTPQNNFKILCEFSTTGIFSGHSCAIYAVRQNGTYTDQYLLNTVLLRNGTLTLDYYGGQTDTGTGLYTISANQKYKLIEEFNTTTRKISLYDSNDNLLEETQPITVTGTISLDNLIAFIGVSGSSSNWQPFENGSIDLKQFKIYVDNKLAYQAVTDPNFTLPMGELYGMIETNRKNIEEKTEEIYTTLDNDKLDTDFSNMNATQTAKNNITDWSAPDYSHGVAVTSLPYTVTQAGYFYATLQHSDRWRYIYVNGNMIGCVNGYSGGLTPANGTSFRVSAGDQITQSSDNNYKCFKEGMFYPMKVSQ